MQWAEGLSLHTLAIQRTGDGIVDLARRQDEPIRHGFESWAHNRAACLRQMRFPELQA
jgi:hypothetical protein